MLATQRRFPGPMGRWTCNKRRHVSIAALVCCVLATVVACMFAGDSSRSFFAARGGQGENDAKRADSKRKRRVFSRSASAAAPLDGMGQAAPDDASSKSSPKLGPLKVASSAIGVLKPVFAAAAKLQAGSYDRAAMREEIQAQVNSAPVVVYTYSLSPFCSEATKLLDSIGARYKEVVLGPEWFAMLGDEASAKRAELGALFGRTSLPHIFIGGRSIGGLAEGSPGLVPLLESGDLVPALKQVGAMPDEGPFGFFLLNDAPKQRCFGDGFCDTATLDTADDDVGLTPIIVFALIIGTFLYFSLS
eukprot:TRINITY_DN13908_c0_g1_i2.p1 TRINITY_DN13908_c0_g1~~TRINITY_DN13908_c0_g1_i2.p1  ORF type:complete len:342 (-),score=48.77 TRINITY_DN13908_c0_g1_i2:278-1189(-)